MKTVYLKRALLGLKIRCTKDKSVEIEVPPSAKHGKDYTIIGDDKLDGIVQVVMEWIGPDPIIIYDCQNED